MDCKTLIKGIGLYFDDEDIQSQLLSTLISLRNNFDEDNGDLIYDLMTDEYLSEQQKFNSIMQIINENKLFS